MQSNPFAITIDGKQYPSVSKILQSDPERKTYYKSVGARRKQAFKDGDAAATARRRGDSLHEAFAQYVTTGECDVSHVYMEFWNHLCQFTIVAIHSPQFYFPSLMRIGGRYRSTGADSMSVDNGEG